MKQTVFQPGVILQEVIVGAFRSQGTTFGAWCTANGVHQSSARQATYGQSGGDTGKALLKRIIDAAGRDVVEMTYRKRMDQHVNGLKGGGGGMTFPHTQFVVSQRFEAELALEGMSDRDRVHFALKLMLDVTDDNAVGALSFAARRAKDHSIHLMAASFNMECG